MTFDRFVAIDWSGARGERLPGVAIAVAEAGNAAPHLVQPADRKGWSRLDVLAFLDDLARDGKALVGADFSFSLPYLDENSYFPAVDDRCKRARELWRRIDDICAGDAHLYARSFVEDACYARFFRKPGGVGHAFRPRLRVTEARCRSAGYGRAESAYNLVGAAQVGLGSLSGMRLLAALDRTGSDLAVWPFAMPEAGRSCFVEMYTRLFLNRAGLRATKARDRATLDGALETLESASYGGESGRWLNDHETDAFLSAAGLRHLLSHPDPRIWNPPELSDKVRVTEGWTFGVV